MNKVLVHLPRFSQSENVSLFNLNYKHYNSDFLTGHVLAIFSNNFMVGRIDHKVLVTDTQWYLLNHHALFSR